MAPAPRLLRVRCATWDQVEAFYRRKLRTGARLSMKVGFAATLGAPVTLVLELPNQIALSIDGEVSGVAEGEGKPVEVTLRGLTPMLIGRLESLVADARAGALDPESADEETRLLSTRRAELARLRRLPAHEVLGVPREPSAFELRGAWLALARREHPDGVARYASPALSAAATEVMAVVGAAYERMRVALVADGRGRAVGASLRPTPSHAFDDPGVDAFAETVTPPIVSDLEVIENRRSLQLAAVEPPADGAVPVPSAEAPTVRLGGDGGGEPGTARVGAGDRFVRQIRAFLAHGDHGGAGHVAEAALQLYPDDRRLRGLAGVATAMQACARGDRSAAIAALEQATAADPGGGEAASALAELRHAAVPTPSLIQRWFA